MKQGQILILVLLAVVVVLAIGLSVASRNITNLRTSTQTEQSQRAFTAAEGGVEDVLSDLPAYARADSGLGCSLAGDISSCDVYVGGLEAKVQVKSSPVYEEQTRLGFVAQIDLDGFNGDRIKVEWAKGNDEFSADDVGSAAVEISLVYGLSPYQIERWYFPGTITGAARGESLGLNPPGASSTSCTPVGFQHCVVVNFSSIPSFISPPQILRIRPFFTGTTVKVAGDDEPLELQKYDVSSTATTEIGVTRKVQVSRSALPQVPAVFDYAIYSESDIIK